MRFKSTLELSFGSFFGTTALVAFCAGFVLLVSVSGALGQSADRPSRTSGEFGDDVRYIQVSPENVRLLSVTPINNGIFPDFSPRAQSPQAADPAAMWSNVTSFSGNATANGGSAVQSGNTITRLIADDAVFSGNAPHFLGAFTFCVANLNAGAVSARARLRFYSDNAGTPGAILAGFSFNPISFAAGVSCFAATYTPPLVVFPTSKNWLAITFDNNTGATGATQAQMDNLGMGLYNPVDTGTSADLIFRTTAAGSFFADSPAGGTINFGANPTANLGFEMLRAGTIKSIVMSGPGPAGPGSTVTWIVTTTPFTNSVTTANFALTGAAAPGSTINSVTPVNSAGMTTYTVTATVGPNAGNLGLSWANTTGLTNNLTNSLPFTGGTAAKADFDGDGKTDISVFRRSEGTWYLSRSFGGFSAVNWGSSLDTFLTGDYDGDGRADFSLWRPSSTGSDADFYILNSNGFTFSGYVWGLPGDIPTIGDYDGDGKIDIVVYRPSDTNWYILKSSTLTFDKFQFGFAGDVPMAMDYNGDGKTDLAVFRPSNQYWYMNNASGTPSQGFVALPWGLASPADILVPADYDGDGKDDMAVWRPSDGTWYILRSSDGGITRAQFGLAGDYAVPGDYDGDGKSDLAVYRPSTGFWYVNRTTAGFLAQSFGSGADNPVPVAYHGQNGPPIPRPQP